MKTLCIDHLRVADGREERLGYTVVRDSGKVLVEPEEGSGVDDMLHAVFGSQGKDDEGSPQFTVSTLFEATPKIEEWNSRRQYSDVQDLLAWLDVAEISQDEKRLQRMQTGQLTFNEVGLFLRQDMEVYVEADRPFAGVLRDISIQYSFFGPYYQLNIEIIEAMSAQGPRYSEIRQSIHGYAGTRSFDSLPIRPITPEEKAALTERGRIFRDNAKNVHYAAYTGTLTRPLWIGDQQFTADGRVMIDPSSMARFDTSTHRTISYGFSHDDEEGPARLATIGDDELWKCWHRLPAFSFATKLWGLVDVEGLRPIAFREDAFTKLVLDKDLKDTILALVRHSGQAFADIIEAKSGGCIFLLHGEPGLGKTLTAEAVAEVLHRPLYAVSIGELGTTPEKLEGSLRQILEMAQRWNAVLLLDEADIFLEKRDERDIVRNAMVGVFLRLLEYHNGVLFLTTNRVKNFDPAFHSRISIALNYHAMTVETRTAVWKNLLEAARIEGVCPSRYAEKPLNGRQIKNAIRLAQTLALSEKQEVGVTHLDRTIALTSQFQADLANS